MQHAPTPAWDLTQVPLHVSHGQSGRADILRGRLSTLRHGAAGIASVSRWPLSCGFFCMVE